MRLILLNGPPASGKSTLARRYLEDQAMALCLDLDDIRASIGQWDRFPTESGLQARVVGLAMARAHLTAGHDVVVPQLLAKLELVTVLRNLADEVGAPFHELILTVPVSVGRERFAGRDGHPVDPLELPSYEQMHEVFQVAVAHREDVPRVDASGDLEETYALLQAALVGKRN